MPQNKQQPVTFKQFFASLINKSVTDTLKLLWAIILPFIILFVMAMPMKADAGLVRIKDIVNFEGVRNNQLIGYGLVVGLNGTGDSLGNSPFTEQSLLGMLDRLGINVRGQNVNTGNIAAVMVTATLPPFTNMGSNIDVSVSALGDSDSLLGGTLLVTPLMGADGDIYAVAQGAVAIAGFSASGEGASIAQNIPTAGRIPNGAIVEKEVDFTLARLKTVRLGLHNPDFTTARRIARRINDFLQNDVAIADNPASIRLTLPHTDLPEGVEEHFTENEKIRSIVDLITDIEQLTVEPDQRARVIIDERSGIIVMGSDVKVDTVAIAQGNLTIRITETPQVSQPGAFAQTGTTEIVPRTTIEIDEDTDSRLGIINETITLQDLVSGLNGLGVGPRDIITILQAIKAAGALQAEIEVL